MTERMIPTLTSASVAARPRPVQITAEELGEDIVAKPLVTNDFTNVRPKSPEVKFRWVEFKAQDGLRYSQALAQGWTNVVLVDIHPESLGTISPYKKDGGTKFLNGDVILMKYDRKRYLGALKLKHQVAAALNDASMLRTVTAKHAARELEMAGAGKFKDAKGNSAMSTFTPGAGDLADTPLATPAGQAEVSRLGSASGPEIGGGGQ